MPKEAKIQSRFENLAMNRYQVFSGWTGSPAARPGLRADELVVCVRLNGYSVPALGADIWEKEWVVAGRVALPILGDGKDCTLVLSQ